MTELGALPEEWEVVRLGDVVIKKKGIQRGPWGGSIKKEIFVPEGYAVFEQGNVISGNINDFRYFITEEKFNELKDFEVKEGDILITAAGTLGKLIVLTDNIHKGIINQALIRIRVNEGIIDKFYFKYFFNQIVKQGVINSYSHGATLKNLSSIKVLQNIALPLPPLSEQQKIAAVLSAVQEAKEKTQAVIDATKSLKKSMMKHLFTYGPVPPEEAENVPLKETEIGKVSEDWEIKTIEKSVESIEYGYSIAIPKNESQDGIYIVSTADITKEGKIHYNYIRKIIPPKKLTERLILKNGDVLFNWRNSPELIGKTSIFEIEPINNNIYTYASFILRIRCDEKSSHNIYVKYILNYYREEGVFVKLARRAVNQANYNRNEINKLKIPLPPLPVQQKIASILSAIDAKIEAEENKKKSLEELFKTLLHNLMTAKIRVNHLEIKS
jgi:type I restriction enzyme S subunit